MELEIKALLLACVDAHKMVPSRFSRSGTNVRQAIRERHSTPRLREPVQLLRASIVLTKPLFDIHEARGPFLTTQPRAKGQRLASPRESILLSTNGTALQNCAVPFGDTHETLRPVLHDRPRVDGQLLAQYTSQIASAQIRESCRLLHASKESQL